MSSHRIDIKLPKSINPENDFCTLTKNTFITHTDPQFIKGIGSGWLNTSQYELQYDGIVEDKIFLLYDEAGLNYVHFFFNFFHSIFKIRLAH